MTHLNEECNTTNFAKKAAQWFEKKENGMTYTEESIEAGCLFALRFGHGGDCVLVFKLDENFEPINYQQLIGSKPCQSS
jgi:hypothetical protein